MAVVAQEFQAAWNAVEAFHGIRKWTPARDKAFRACLRDAWWRDSWREALARAAASKFCSGDGDRGWRADVDWFLRPDTVAQVLEGKYDQRKILSPLERFFRNHEETRAKKGGPG